MDGFCMIGASAMKELMVKGRMLEKRSDKIYIMV